MVYVLSVKYKNQTVRNPNFNVKRKNDDKQKKKKKRLWYNKARPRTNALTLMLENLDLRYSTWLSPSLVGQGRPSCQEPDTMRKSSFIPLLGLGRHEISLIALDWDLR